jgi:hypothetical protein
MGSNFLKINLTDIWQSLLTAIFMAIITTLVQWLSPTLTGAMPSFDFINLKITFICALGTGISNILKRWLQNSSGKLLKVEPTE